MKKNVYLCRRIMIRVTRYSAGMAAEWDAFVKGAKNGSFLFMRNYMDYHSCRFHDHSLMFRTNDGRLAAILPANECEGVLHSHQGLTYGGLLLLPRTHLADVGEMTERLMDYMKQNGLQELVYKPVPAIYHRLPAEEDLYWLWRLGATVAGRSVMTVVALGCDAMPCVSARKRSYCNRLLRQGLTVTYDAPLDDFWHVLEGNLMERHGAKPVHTLGEIRLLKAAFPRNIVCATVSDDHGAVLAGVVLYVTAQVVKTQYISASEAGRRQHALDFLLMQVAERCRDMSGCRYLDLGTSMLSGGETFDGGLVAQKEGFGGRTVVCDILSVKP